MHITEEELIDKIQVMGNKIESIGRDTLTCLISDNNQYQIQINQHFYMNKGGFIVPPYESDCVFHTLEEANTAINNFYRNFPSGTYTIPRPI